MSNDPARYCATDKEIYDLLMSSKKKISDVVMLALARDRGIIYSPKESRDELASTISLLTHGFHDLSVLIEQRELASRGEKTTSITLPTLTIEELKAVSLAFSADAVGEDKVTSFQKGTDGYEVKVQYSEMDYSRTRLIQRRQREASIEFEVQPDRTVVRLPSTEKAQAIAEELRKRIEESRKAIVSAVRTELTAMNSAPLRTEFFTKLITEMPGFSLANVTSIKVQSSDFTDEDTDDYIDNDATAEDAQSEILSIVQNAALKGHSLLSTDLYQRLQEGGFFITSIVWDAKDQATQSIIQFEAGFEEPKAGKGFRYNVRGVRRYENGEHTKTYRPVPEGERNFLFDVIERAATKGLEELIEKQAASQGAP
jgi:hypothetical protein